MQKPSIGRIVHYTSFGSPVAVDGSQKYKPVCRAAVVTEVHENGCVGLAILNLTGIFFDQHVAEWHAPMTTAGTWHWPEVV